MPAEPWAIGLVLLATIVGAFGPVFMKKASGRMKFSLKSLLTNHYLILGFLLYGLSTVLFVPALKGGDLSVIYPIVSVTYVWVSLLSIHYLKEKMSVWKWAGIFFVLLGVVLITLGRA
ncbi:MAG: EamA family transporter [Candidatus Woesearchaeota archaeon]